MQPTLQPKMAGPEATVVNCSFFHVEKWTLETGRVALENTGGRFAIFTCLEGAVECAGKNFAPGDFWLVPAALTTAEIKPTETGTTLLRTTVP